MIVEYDDAENGYMPELSFGSHMFQDMVESGILYTALFSMGNRPAVFERSLLARMAVPLPLPNASPRLNDAVALFDTKGLSLYYDMMSGRAVCLFEPEAFALRRQPISSK